MTFLLFVVCVTSMRRVGRTSTYLGRLRFVGCESSANLGHAPVADGISRGVSMVLPSGGGPIFGMAAQARHSGPLCIQDSAVPRAARYGAPSRCFRQVFYEHLGMLTFFRPKASYVSIPSDFPRVHADLQSFPFWVGFSSASAFVDFADDTNTSPASSVLLAGAPARCISTIASSALASRPRRRSMIAVVNRPPSRSGHLIRIHSHLLI